MTVKEVINMLSYGERFTLIGARTGKTLYRSNVNTKKCLEKYLDMDCTEQPIRAIFDANICKVTKQVEFITPMISLWVSGE